jgi:hypothetical protein
MGTQQQLMTGLYVSMSSDTAAGGVSTLTGGRIYELEGQPNAALPLLVFNLAVDTPLAAFNAETLEGEVQADIYASNEAGVTVGRTIAARLLALWHRTALTVTGWNRVTMLKLGDGIASVEDDANRIIMRFKLFAS